jgi:D-beta-D-heptose 7-phosphate kinase/D-beta-D-heptose 1-phosphate adenosyltransferase
MPAQKTHAKQNSQKTANVGLSASKAERILSQASKSKVLVIGDVMLDQFIYGNAHRISPEAPVPVVDFERQSSMPGGAGNVARNLASLGVPTELFGVVGNDAAATELVKLLREQNIGSTGLTISTIHPRETTTKMRIIADRQQLVRIDRETRDPISKLSTNLILSAVKRELPGTRAVIISDYGKGMITKEVFDTVKKLCQDHDIWLGIDPKFSHHIDLKGISLIKPNRKVAFEMAKWHDQTKTANPLNDFNLMQVSEKLLAELQPKVLMITLGEQGMLICRPGRRPIHLPTTAQEVFDVSGAGDTTIATFTMAISAGASPIEAAIMSNHAAGIVVGKVGTATVSPEELLKSFRRR